LCCDGRPILSPYPRLRDAASDGRRADSARLPSDLHLEATDAERREDPLEFRPRGVEGALHRANAIRVLEAVGRGPVPLPVAIFDGEGARRPLRSAERAEVDPSMERELRIVHHIQAEEPA